MKKIIKALSFHIYFFITTFDSEKSVKYDNKIFGEIHN